MGDQPDVVTKILQAYREAVAARDVEAFLALYADDVHLFDMWDRYEITGIDAWREMVVDWFGAHPGKALMPGLTMSVLSRGRMWPSRTCR